MTSTVESVLPNDTLATVEDRLVRAQVSCLAVVSDDDELVGVISRTDLLREARAQRSKGEEHASTGLSFLESPVSEVMTREVVVVYGEQSVAHAASLMCERGVHRVFVISESRLSGVFSTLDVMAAIQDAVSMETIAANMSTPVVVVDVEEKAQRAADLLASENVSGLVVVENEWPVGVFTQVEALASGELGAEVLVADAMDPALICMPADTPMHRAAQQGIRMRVRRIVVAENRHMRGILSGLDFAAFVAGLPRD